MKVELMKLSFCLYIFLTVSLVIILQVYSGHNAAAAEAAQYEVSEIEKLYRYKCSLCHPVPDIEAAGYTYQEWLNVMQAMHEPGRYGESVNTEDDALLKGYLKTMSQK